MSIDHEAYCYDGEASSDRDFLRVEPLLLNTLEISITAPICREKDHVDPQDVQRTRTRFP